MNTTDLGADVRLSTGTTVQAERAPWLSGSVAVVTAAAGAGIGGAIVRRFLREGATVIASDRHPRRLELLRDETGVQAEVIDVGHPEALARHLNKVLAEHGRIDVLVNCAGIGIMGPVWEISDDDWYRVMDVNVTATLRACRVVIPNMIRTGRGAIVNIASISAWNPSEHEAAYSVSKASLVALTRGIAKDVAGYQIRVNAIAPGLVESRFIPSIYTPERIAAMKSTAPLGRGVLPTEVAAAAAWLASEEASYVTGETLTLAGGAFIR